MFRRLVQLAVFIFLAAWTSVAQQDGTSVGGTQQVSGAARISHLSAGGVSFEQAIRLAIENNLSTLLARERRNEARGEKQQLLSPLLPQVSAAAYQASMTENVVAGAST